MENGKGPEMASYSILRCHCMRQCCPIRAGASSAIVAKLPCRRCAGGGLGIAFFGSLRAIPCPPWPWRRRMFKSRVRRSAERRYSFRFPHHCISPLPNCPAAICMKHSFSRGSCPEGRQGDLNAKAQSREAAKSFFRHGLLASLQCYVGKLRIFGKIPRTVFPNDK